MLSNLCVCGCGKPIPDHRRLGTAYFNRAHKQKHHRQKVKLKHDSMYMKIDLDAILLAIPQKKIIDGLCPNCESLTQVDCGIHSGRQVRFCGDCQTVSRRRI